MTDGVEALSPALLSPATGSSPSLSVGVAEAETKGEEKAPAVDKRQKQGTQATAEPIVQSESQEWRVPEPYVAAFGPAAQPLHAEETPTEVHPAPSEVPSPRQKAKAESRVQERPTERPKQAAAKARKEREQAPAMAAEATKAREGRFYCVQIGAFLSHKSAKELCRRLRADGGVPVWIDRPDVGRKGTLHPVCIGHFESMGEAARFGRMLDPAQFKGAFPKAIRYNDLPEKAWQQLAQPDMLPETVSPAKGTRSKREWVYTMQVCAFRDRNIAEEIAEELSRNPEFDAWIGEPDMGSKGTFYPVRVGRFANREQAEQVKGILDGTRFKDAFIIRSSEG